MLVSIAVVTMVTNKKGNMTGIQSICKNTMFTLGRTYIKLEGWSLELQLNLILTFGTMTSNIFWIRSIFYKPPYNLVHPTYMGKITAKTISVRSPWNMLLLQNIWFYPPLLAYIVIMTAIPMNTNHTRSSFQSVLINLCDDCKQLLEMEMIYFENRKTSWQVVPLQKQEYLTWWREQGIRRVSHK